MTCSFDEFLLCGVSTPEVRKHYPGSSVFESRWISAFAGMTSLFLAETR